MNKTKQLSPWETTCKNRIRQLIDEYCDGNQQRFVDKTGLNKGSVSQYVNGKNVPSEANAIKIASAFNVDPDWVRGFDTIPPGIDDEALAWYGKFLAADPETRKVIERLLRDP